MQKKERKQFNFIGFNINNFSPRYHRELLHMNIQYIHTPYTYKCLKILFKIFIWKTIKLTSWWNRNIIESRFKIFIFYLKFMWAIKTNEILWHFHSVFSIIFKHTYTFKSKYISLHIYMILSFKIFVFIYM